MKSILPVQSMSELEHRRLYKIDRLPPINTPCAEPLRDNFSVLKEYEIFHRIMLF